MQYLTRSPPLNSPQSRRKRHLFLAVFLKKFNRCRPELAGEVVSGMTVDWVGLVVRVKFGDSTLNSDRIMLRFAGRTGFTRVCAVFNCIFCNQSKKLVMSYLVWL